MFLRNLSLLSFLLSPALFFRSDRTRKEKAGEEKGRGETRQKRFSGRRKGPENRRRSRGTGEKIPAQLANDDLSLIFYGKTNGTRDTNSNKRNSDISHAVINPLCLQDWSRSAYLFVSFSRKSTSIRRNYIRNFYRDLNLEYFKIENIQNAYEPGLTCRECVYLAGVHACRNSCERNRTRFTPGELSSSL